MKFKLTWKLWLLIFVLFLSLISIFGLPPKIFQKGVLITDVTQNSSEFDQGLRKGGIITSVDGISISSAKDYYDILNKKFPSQEKIKTIFKIKSSNNEIILFSNQTPQITVSNLPKSNIKTGLDISGGARALVKAKNKTLTSQELSDLVEITRNRLNVYGLTDMNVVPVSDFSGNRFMLIEIAGATPNDLSELISKQGKFEAKIENDIVFIGGNRDVASVCRNDATCAGIESCNPNNDGSYYCNFRFSVYLSAAAAERHAKITSNLSIDPSDPQYLSKKLDLYLDGNLVDSLYIGKDLKGSSTTQIAISGSGSGPTQEDAYNSAEESMHKLQTILITGSLPYELEIVKLDTISPVLGEQFSKLILIAGIVALVAASLVVFVRYRELKASLALIFTSFSEIIIILGIASFIGWNLDLPSIAGILATIGTGFDDQIVILDEARHTQTLSLKERFKRAFAIILGAYFTVVGSLLPLMWAGAGLLKGFAITTLIGISVGVFITRPTFADIIKYIEE